tara:strand:- start:555 stop:1157 length:603 start_codon:yes stop_codon:yes gene_type:complete
MITIFVLKLENDKYFVYYTYEKNLDYNKINILKFDFIKNFKVLTCIEELYNCNIFDVDKIVKIYMNKYGIENVRGGTYVNDKLTHNETHILEQELQFINNQTKKNNELLKILENENNILIHEAIKKPVIIQKHVYYIPCNICKYNCVGRGSYTEYNTIITNPIYYKDITCCFECSKTLMGKLLIDNDCKKYLIRGFVKHN